MSTLTGTLPRSRRGPGVALAVGAGLAVASLIGVVLDQVLGLSIARHALALYAPIGFDSGEAIPLFVYLYAVGGTALVLWFVLIWGIWRRKRGARIVATVMVAALAAIALPTLVTEEFEGIVYPTFWGIAGFVPVVAGLVGVIWLWTLPAAHPRSAPTSAAS